MNILLKQVSGSEASKRSSSRLKSLGMLSAALLPMALAAQSAQAQENEIREKEIIVTAQKREQSVLEVPASITAFSAETVAKLNFSSFTSISQSVPNFNVSYQRGGSATPSLTIRGVRGDDSPSRMNESSVAMYVDEVYLGAETSLTGQLFDVARVEVLRGPQGTLFGRNTTAGLVHFISASPTRTFSGFANAQYGSDNQVNLEGGVSGPISESVRFRLSGKWDRDDGHWKNIATTAGAPLKLGGKNEWGLRGTLDFDVSANTLATLIVSHSQAHSELTPGVGYGVRTPGTGVLCSLEDTFAGKCVSVFQPACQRSQGAYNQAPRLPRCREANWRSFKKRRQ